jgi:subtilisin family serine protease
MIREYIVTKDILNIRSGPSEQANFRGQLLKGETVWLDDKEIIGITPLGGVTTIWLVYSSNDFVSKDGLRVKNYEDKKSEFINDSFNSQFIDITDPTNEDKWKVSWAHVDLEIWKIWRDQKYTAYFDYGKITGLDSNNNNSSDYADVNGHGTEIASIIVGNGDELIGIAPAAELFICKYYDNDPLIDNLIKALQMLPSDLEVICISTGFLRREFSTDQKNILLGVIEQKAEHAIIFCSVGDDNNHDDNPIDRYPSSLSSNVISVSSTNKLREISSFSTKSNNVKISAPGEEIKAIDFKNDDISKVSGTSFSVPIVAGITALLRSHFNLLSVSEIKTRLLSCLEPLGDRTMYGDGIINPVRSFLI